MKKIVFTMIICSVAVIMSISVHAQTAKSNEPSVDTKGTEALKKQATDKTNIPDSKKAVPAKMQQDGGDQKAVVKKEEEQLTKAVKIEAVPAPVAQDRPRGSTIDDQKQPPARTPAQPMVPKEAQRVNN